MGRDLCRSSPASLLKQGHLRPPPQAQVAAVPCLAVAHKGGSTVVLRSALLWAEGGCFLCLDEAGLQNKDPLKMWLLLTFCLFVPVLMGLILMVVKRKELRQCLSTEQLEIDE